MNRNFYDSHSISNDEDDVRNILGWHVLSIGGFPTNEIRFTLKKPKKSINEWIIEI